MSFWQETDNPKLGSSDNKIVHNLFITTGRHGVQFINNSTRNEFANNVLLGVRIERRQGDGESVGGADGGRRHGRRERLPLEPLRLGQGRRAHAECAGDGARRTSRRLVCASSRAALNHDPNDFRPTASAPFLGMGTLSPYAPTDRNGVVRSGRVDLGPIEVP